MNSKLPTDCRDRQLFLEQMGNEQNEVLAYGSFLFIPKINSKSNERKLLAYVPFILISYSHLFLEWGQLRNRSGFFFFFFLIMLRDLATLFC